MIYTTHLLTDYSHPWNDGGGITRCGINLYDDPNVSEQHSWNSLSFFIDKERPQDKRCQICQDTITGLEYLSVCEL